MATCKYCGKSGLFLKVSTNGYCIDCEKIISAEISQNTKLQKNTSSLYTGASKLTIAELEVLTKFLRVSTSDYLTTILYGKQWEDVSKTSITKTIQKLIDGKLIIPPDLSQQLDYAYKASELKGFCNERGIKASGKKDELIERLIATDETGMRTKVKDKNIFICSNEGNKLAKDYLDFRNNESDLAKGAILQALKMRDCKLASRTLINYESNQFFQRGINIDWKQEKEENYIPTLSYILSKVPTVLRDIPEEKLELLRLVAGLNYLWGKNDWSLLDNAENISSKYDNVTCARLLDSYSRNLREIKEYHVLAVETGNRKYKVEINTCNDEFVCSECAKLAKKKYPLSGEIPELPHIDCKNGCRCSYSLDIGL